jgi:substrate import-associated zinc metallohydrolase lipoprotein
MKKIFKFDIKKLRFSQLIWLGLLSVILVTACNKNKDILSTKVDGLGGPVFTKTPLDNWLSENFTKPYNIEVKYRWDPYEVPLNKTLVPPQTDKIQPTMEAVKKIWIEPYEQEAGSNFIKKFCPKQYILVGSANWNTDGTIVLGTAEGGRKVVLYVVNYFDRKNIDGIKEMLHTIHHEFGHILHQNILYPASYKQITPGDYTSNWYNVSNEAALNLGFVTPYSMSSADEDFVEMIATMLVEGKAGFDAIVEKATEASAKAALRKKEQIVVDYFSKTYNINFRNLQTRTQAAITEFSK